MTEQEEDVAIKERELRLAETTLNYWRDELRSEEMAGEPPCKVNATLLEMERARAAADIAEIRYTAAKSRLVIRK